MVIKSYSHVGHIVKDINKGIDLYTRIFGLKARSSEIMMIPGGKAFMISVGNNAIELIEPTDSEHRVGKFLSTHGEGLFHLSCKVDDIDSAVKSLREKGVSVEDPRFILPSRPGPRIAFLDPESACGAYIELAQDPDNQ
ncbi:MAG: VOC family protein [Dehalococcoidales bacterium]|nr:MAG: VOC family protein [Dehalococcoidales bacterium]